MEKYLRQHLITKNNRARLRMLAKSGNQRTREIAALITRIAIIAPRKRQRFQNLSTNDPDLLWEWERLGLPIPIEYPLGIVKHLSVEDEYALDADVIYELGPKDANGNYDYNKILVRRRVASADFEGPGYPVDDDRELPF